MPWRIYIKGRFYHFYVISNRIIQKRTNNFIQIKWKKIQWKLMYFVYFLFIFYILNLPNNKSLWCNHITHTQYQNQYKMQIKNGFIGFLLYQCVHALRIMNNGCSCSINSTRKSPLKTVLRLKIFNSTENSSFSLFVKCHSMYNL